MRCFVFPNSYQLNGNISQIVDVARGDETLNYTYDEFDRFDTVSGAYSQDYAYDTTGNMTAKDSAWVEASRREKKNRLDCWPGLPNPGSNKTKIR